jgi:hypothetical protein
MNGVFPNLLEASKAELQGAERRFALAKQGAQITFRL